ncbi:HNH endonuclease [Mesorhizobium ciceri]|uniref:HNH endonuclease n=1 Tax=Mesorhizobium ciceri TaxID=39645 RepID=UPI000A827F5F|nr:HNH endonuclease [Mesorhizobium ciceri]
MKLTEIDMGRHETQKVTPPGCCIYCGSTEELTDEHVVPFALAANSVIYLDASCKACAAIIQRYEQDVLRKQLGVFRAQVDAPTRNKKARVQNADVHFFEIDDMGRQIRDLGSRNFPVGELPLTLNLWQLPEARILRPDAVAGDDYGRAWSFTEMAVTDRINRTVAQQTGSKHVAMKLGDVNRSNFLRFLAKTAHAFAVMTLGPNSFRPFLADVILKRSDDLTQFVGGGFPAAPHEVDPAHTTLLSLGSPDAGPAKGLIAIRLQFWHELKTPAYIVMVGEPIRSLDEIFGEHADSAKSASENTFRDTQVITRALPASRSRQRYLHARNSPESSL